MSTLRTLLLLSTAPLLLAGCPGDTTTTLPSKVTVTLSYPSTNVVGSQIEVDVKVSACDQVTTASLYDGTTLLKNFSMDSNPQAVILTAQDISFRQDGLAAQLDLTAQVTCSDARTGTSKHSGAQFLPVAEVDSPTTTAFVAPKFFFVDGTGDLTTFVGCVKQTNGTSLLQRFNKQGVVLNTQDRTDVQCSDGSIFTDAGGGTAGVANSGVRWMLTPDVGAIAFNYALQVTSIAEAPTGQDGNGNPTNYQAIKGDSIIINPDDGNAIIWVRPAQPLQPVSSMFRVRPDCLPNKSCPARTDSTTQYTAGSPIVWDTVITDDVTENINFELLGDPILVNEGNFGRFVLVSGYIPDSTLTTYNFEVRSIFYDENQGADSGPGADHREYDQARIALDGASVTTTVGQDLTAVGLLAIDPDATRVYLPHQTQTSPTTISEVWAFNDTASGAPIWKSSDLPDNITQVVPYGNGTRVAAIAPHQVWLLNAQDGQVLNLTHPIKAHGSYYVLYVEPGPGEELYIMTGPPPATTGAVPVPGELITVQYATDGELVRFQVGTGTLFARSGTDGTLWMRVNGSVVKMFNAADYATLKNQ